MDVLSDVLETIRLHQLRLTRVESGAPTEVPAAPGRPAFYWIESGAALLAAENAAERRLERGDFVLLPGGTAHTLRPEAGASIVSGRFEIEGGIHPLTSALPGVIHVGAGEPAASSFQSLLRLASESGRDGVPGSTALADRVAEAMFIQAVRTVLASPASEATGAWLRALADPVIGGALARVHEQPEHPWTVASLAKTVHLSRSAFAARFTTVVGESPLQYVARWRMQKAAGLLRSTEDTLAQVADAIGYDSEAAFSKAYKRWVGVSPGAYRRAARASLRTRRPSVPPRLGALATAGLALD
jgi:AraC-like DNA-binding protein